MRDQYPPRVLPVRARRLAPSRCGPARRRWACRPWLRIGLASRPVAWLRGTRRDRPFAPGLRAGKAGAARQAPALAQPGTAHHLPGSPVGQGGAAGENRGGQAAPPSINAARPASAPLARTPGAPTAHPAPSPETAGRAAPSTAPSRPVPPPVVHAPQAPAPHAATPPATLGRAAPPPPRAATPPVTTPPPVAHTPSPPAVHAPPPSTVGRAPPPHAAIAPPPRPVAPGPRRPRPCMRRHPRHRGDHTRVTDFFIDIRERVARIAPAIRAQPCRRRSAMARGGV